MRTMQLPPNPRLRDVIKTCKNSKDVDFVANFFDSSISGLYPTVRHRYNELVDIVANGIGHLKLFTKFLKQIIDAQQLSSNSCLHIIEQYKQEEPTLSTASGFVKIADETSVSLPPQFQSQNSDEKNEDILNLHKKTDIDAFSDVLTFERNMGKLLVLYWNRLNSEIYEPLYEYRKICITKLEAIQLYISDKYDKLIKHSNKLRETKVSTISLWNDLCDLTHTLRKQRNNAPDSNKTKKLANKCKTIQLKVKKQFEIVVDQVDKCNNLSDEFWNEIIYKACLQLEAMEYSRISFYTEYFDKYHELLKWRKCELENGSNTLERARKMLMSPFEIAEYGIHPIRVDSGNYNTIQPQQYELPCMPEDIPTLTGKITEQRIDPSILVPVYNPFGSDGLKPSTSRHIKSNYSRADSISLAHDRNLSLSVSQSMTSIIGSQDAPLPFGMQSASFFSSHPSSTNTASKLFSRTHRAQTHNGGLPRLPNQYDSDSHSHNSMEYTGTGTASTPSLGSIQAPPGKPPKPHGKPPSKPPRKVPGGVNIDGARKATLPLRNRPLPSPSRSPTNSPHNSPRPNLPPRPPPNLNAFGSMKVLTPTSPYNGKFVKPPQLPPRRKTLPMGNFKRKPPKKSPVKVAEAVRKTSTIYASDGGNSPNDVDNKKKKKSKKWKLGK